MDAWVNLGRAGEFADVKRIVEHFGKHVGIHWPALGISKPFGIHYGCQTRQ